MWCFHDRLKEFVFKCGAKIMSCVDCTTFDNKRNETLRVGTAELPKAQEQIHWELLLEKAGLGEHVAEMPWLNYVGTTDSLGNNPNVYYTPECLGDEPKWSSWITQIVQPLFKKLYDQRRIDAAKRYTMIDDHEHDERACTFYHSQTMPRGLKNFCATCGSYEPVEHECKRDGLQQTIVMREQERSRIVRDAKIKVSKPFVLAPSRILEKKGGYGKHIST